jgi:hypothetical protein
LAMDGQCKDVSVQITAHPGWASKERQNLVLVFDSEWMDSDAVQRNR